MIKNYTGVPVTVLKNDGSLVSYDVDGCASSEMVLEDIDTRDGINITMRKSGVTFNLPKENYGTLIIVTKEVLEADLFMETDRSDIVVASEPVFDADCNLAYYKSLSIN